MRRTSVVLIAFGLLASTPGPEALAHGDVHEQIQKLTEEIARNPKNAQLHLRRGRLFRIHGDFDKALADFDSAEKLDPKMEILDLERGETYLDAEQPQKAKAALDRFLARHPAQDRALLARGRVQVKLGFFAAAAKDFTAAIEHGSELRPEYFIERAQAQLRVKNPDLDAVVKGLDEGIRKLGPAVTLHLQAIEVELKAKAWDAALARVDELAKQSPRRENWLARRGDILVQAGRRDEARTAYNAALEALHSLPERLRWLKATQELEVQINAALAGLK